MSARPEICGSGGCRIWLCIWGLIPIYSACGAGLELQWTKVVNERTISGGDFGVSGRPAPADLGKMQGGDFVLAEGSGGAMVTVRENLGIEMENGTNRVFWSWLAVDWLLETNSAIGNGQWEAVPPGQWAMEGRYLAYRATPGGGACFFRLVKPEPPEP